MRKGSITARRLTAGIFGLSLRRWRVAYAAGGHRQAEIRRHARDRHRLRDAVGAVVGSRTTGTGSTTTTPASSTSSCSPPTSPRRKRNGGKHPFYADAWLPSDAIRGELAESWEWKENPLRVEIKLRKGVMFPEKPGVMTGARARRRRRGLQLQPARQEPEARSRATSTTSTRSRRPTSTRWSSPSRTTTPSGTIASARATTRGIIPKEVADAGAANWKNVNGTGPFMLTDFVQGNSNTYVKNPNYWDKEKINGGEYKLPFVDKLIYRTIKDEATFITALRTGKLDILESDPLAERRRAEEERAAAASGRSGSTCRGTFLAMRVDTKPFDDIRVRRALNMAVNKQEIVKAYYNGNAELFAYPQHPDYIGYFEPLEAMPASSRSCSRTIPTRRRSCWPKPAYPRASPSRCRSAPATPTTWTCCRWSPPISRRSASRSRSSRWSMARSSRR